MDKYQYLLDWEIVGNSSTQVLTALVVFAVIYVFLLLLKRYVLLRLVKLAQKTKTDIDDAVVVFIKDINQLFYILIALYVALKGLSIPESIGIVVNIVFLVAVVSQVIRLLEGIIGMILDKRMRKEDGTSAMPQMFKLIIRACLWVVGALLILSNLGINVNSLIAGLGIGGLAISLALQGILSDMFSSFSIAIDKPFEEGDYIVVGEFKGTVKHIGLKTTRIQALQGEEIVISNNELTSAKVQNFKKMQKRRISFNIGVTYDTSQDQLQKIDGIIKSAIESQSDTEFDRVHFNEFGDFSLNFAVVYYMLTSEYAKYMDTQQAINFAILGEFEKEGIEIAFPTQTVYLKKD